VYYVLRLCTMVLIIHVWPNQDCTDQRSGLFQDKNLLKNFKIIFRDFRGTIENSQTDCIIIFDNLKMLHQQPYTYQILFIVIKIYKLYLLNKHIPSANVKLLEQEKYYISEL